MSWETLLLCASPLIVGMGIVLFMYWWLQAHVVVPAPYYKIPFNAGITLKDLSETE